MADLHKVAIHEEDTTDSGSQNFSDSEEGSSESGHHQRARKHSSPSVAPPVTCEPKKTTNKISPAKQQQQQQQQPQPQQKASGKKPKAPVSSLRATLRSKGNTVMAEVGTAPPASKTKGAATKAELPSWLAPTSSKPSLYACTAGQSAQTHAPAPEVAKAPAAPTVNCVPVHVGSMDPPGLQGAPCRGVVAPPPGLGLDVYPLPDAGVRRAGYEYDMYPSLLSAPRSACAAVYDYSDAAGYPYYHPVDSRMPRFLREEYSRDERAASQNYIARF
eukprot:CAMPEP_0206584458 /NCGR_PEP_ID=MMETSP0325_2-20121206/35735_1 /ASSEMBLY_ACC=CAM_ASM_000347 /TAXON_ID=2866 /ORGANISM="Crypthecodinium cohnii, Strain Seligo" /LENGTH=273 /DNA_ID=CAMNT_0054091621 /DNA_START=26 /DNA_END=847 /DNA_ORIENTATION=-